MNEEIPFYRPPRPQVHMLLSLTKQIADSKQVSNGPLCRELESRVRDYHDAQYAVSCSNCTMGLALALQALKTLTGAKTAFLPAFTWYSTDWAAKAAGLNRAYVDVNPSTWLMEPSGEAKEIAIPVGVFGAAVNPADYEGVVLVDGAHLFGVKIDLSLAAGVVMSFSPSKILTCGEGGILLTNYSELASKFAELRDRYARMSEMEAAMGLCHWDGRDAFLRDKRLRWEKYARVFKRPQIAQVTNWSVSAFRVKERDKLDGYLKSRGIETRIY